MMNQHPGQGASRFGSYIARVHIVVAVLLLAAMGSQAALAQSQTRDTTPPTVSLTSPAAGAHVTGTVILTATAADAVGVRSVAFLVNGNIIGTDRSSPYSLSWYTGSTPPGSHALRAEARDAAGNVGTSAPVTVTIRSAADTTPPTVSITSPADGARVTGTVTIAATASDAASVAFLVNGTVIGTDTSSPYSASWDTSGVPAGSHTLRAEARDAAGNVGTSATVTVTVTVAGNRAPSVTMTAPASGSTYQTAAIITAAASATDSDGSVSRVDFYAGSLLIGSDTTSPFSVTWPAAAAGTYGFSANAVDNAGAVTTSASVSVTVTNSPNPGTAIFTPSTTGSAVIRYVLEVFTNGANPATSTALATQDLGKPGVVNGESTASVLQTVASLPPGTYIATLTAVGSSQSARSLPSPPFVIRSSSSVITSSISPTGDTVESTSSSVPSGREAPSTAPSATESRGTLWVTNSSTSMVTAFDATTGDVLATIPVGLTPTGIAAPRGVGKVYVADEGSDTVSVISKATMTLAGTIPLPSPFGRRPHHISGSPDGRFVYVGELGTNVVDVIDTATDHVSARFSTGWPGSTTRVVVPDQSGEVLYAVNRGTAPSPSTLVALEAGTGRWLWQLPLDGDPSDFLLGSDGRTGILTYRAGSTIALIDLERHAVVKEIDLGAGNEAGTLQLSADGRSLVLTLRSTPVRVGIVDLAEIATLRTVPLGGAATRTALPAAQLSYVCVSGSSEFAPGVIAVDAASHTVVNRFRFPGGGSPHGVVFDPH